ncbi:MAG: hypothetical protein SF051_03720 [Elusimicrobiota bacterium]|nr:hypothetical protein [Elusimicrobiota bacterium]
MSEQTKGNFQMIGAGVMGFVAVVGVAGLVLTHDGGRGSLLSRVSASAPALSAPEPSITRPALSREAAASSPAPVIGSVADPLVDETAAAPAHAPAAVASGAAMPAPASSLGALGAPRHAGEGETVSTARAQVEAFREPAKKEAAVAAAPAALKPVPRIALDKTGARNSIASAVHYGVTSRSELMGNAAGPVYNFAGRKVAGGPRLSQLAGSAEAQMTEAERKIAENPSLSAEQKADMLARLKQARGGTDAAK